MNDKKMSKTTFRILSVLILTVLLLTGLVACSAPATPATPAVSSSVGAVASSAGTSTPSEVASESSTTASSNTTASDGKTYKVGITFSDLSNPVWAELVQEAITYGKGKGMTITSVDAKNDASTQVSQIENFIQNKMDAIIVCAVDSASVKDVTKKAMDSGVVVIGYTQVLDNCNAQYLVNPYSTGQVCGKAAAQWINDHFKTTDTVEWGLMDLPRFPEIIDRANGIKAAVAAGAPNAKLVATASALTADDGLKNAENFLQANPNMKVICCIGGGGGVGGNEGVKAASKNSPDFGLFAIDATQQEIQNIINGDPERASVSLGGGKAHADILIDLAYKCLNKENVIKDNFMPATLIDKTNAQDYYNNIYGSSSPGSSPSGT